MLLQFPRESIEHFPIESTRRTIVFEYFNYAFGEFVILQDRLAEAG